MQHKVSVLVPLAALFFLGFAGCADKLTRANFSRIRQNDSTMMDVTWAIGDPNEKLGDTWLYKRPGKQLTALIVFDENNRVVRTQWIDGRGGEWIDSGDATSPDGSHKSTTIETRN